MTQTNRASSAPPSTTGAVYVEPSAETVLNAGTKIGDLFRRNMTQPYVLQRLAERVYWVQSFNYGTVFYVGEPGVLIFDTLEGVYDNIPKDVTSVTDKPIVAAVYPHYHADHIGDIDKYVEAARQQGFDFDGLTVELHGFEWAAHSEANFFATISREATDALRPKYGQLYGFEDATPPNAEMAAWTIFEYR